MPNKQRASWKNGRNWKSSSSSLTDRGDALYTPGRSMISDQPPPIDEQTALQIEELQAAIAEIDEALKGAA